MLLTMMTSCRYVMALLVDANQQLASLVASGSHVAGKHDHVVLCGCLANILVLGIGNQACINNCIGNLNPSLTTDLRAARYKNENANKTYGTYKTKRNIEKTRQMLK